MIRAKSKDEGGWVLVTAAVLMSVMMLVGLAATQLVTADTHRSRNARESESALNLDEGVLYAQSLILAQNWPSASTHPYAVNYCSSATATASTVGCPNPANLAGSGGSSNFSNVDQKAATTWKTKVRDNGGALATAYDPTVADNPQPNCAVNAPCTWDANGDNKVWVQSQTFVRGHPRNVVALMQLEAVREQIPRTAVTSGALSVTNNGNHGGTPIIDATGSQVLVRCDPTSSGCVQANTGQVTPTATTSATTIPPMMTPAQLARFKSRAISDGHYFPGCPTKNASNQYDLSGAVVWVEGCTSPPNLANSVKTTPCSPPNGMAGACVNNDGSTTPAKDTPGILIWHCGRADLQGGFTYRGVLYIANNSDGTCPAGLPQIGTAPGSCSSSPNVDSSRDVLNTSGGFGVWGAVAADGPGCLKVGSNNLQIKFDNRVFDAIESYGTVGLVQNTWRELQPDAF